MTCNHCESKIPLGTTRILHRTITNNGHELKFDQTVNHCVICGHDKITPDQEEAVRLIIENFMKVR